MRVMLVAQSDVTTVLGGLERHVLSLAGHLSKRGHHVAIVVPGRHPGRILHDSGTEVVRLGALFTRVVALYRSAPIHPQFPDVAFALSLRRLVRGWRPDVVHSHGLALFSVGPAMRGLGVPWVHTLHDYGLLCPKGSLWKLPDEASCTEPMTAACIRCHAQEEPKGLLSPLRPIAIMPTLVLGRRVLPLAQGYIAVSEFVAEAHRRFLPAIANWVSVIPNFLGHDNDDGNARVELPQASFILFAGSAAAQKGAHVLLQAFRGVCADVRLLVMATGPAAWLQDLRRKVDDRTDFYENVPHSALIPDLLYQRAAAIRLTTERQRGYHG